MGTQTVACAVLKYIYRVYSTDLQILLRDSFETLVKCCK